jgi:VWFA-related protein
MDVPLMAVARVRSSMLCLKQSSFGFLAQRYIRSHRCMALVALLTVALLIIGRAAWSQSQPSVKPETQPSSQSPQAQTDTIPAKVEGAPYSMRVTVPLVTLDVSVLTENRYFVPELKKENFRVLEDGVSQTVASFSERHGAITVVLLVEFTADLAQWQRNALRASYRFTKTLKNEDWAALILFDRHLHIAQDFTQDKSAVQEILSKVELPLSREINMFDALIETLDRLQQVEGHKYIVLMASGQDTFSKAVLDDVLKRLEMSKDTVIYSIATGHGLDHLQADNQMSVFARMTGGRVFFPFSEEEYGDAFRDIGQTIRNHYVLSYRPTNKAQDGNWHAIKVTVVNPAESVPGSKDDIGRKYQVIVRQGYRAKRPGE